MGIQEKSVGFFFTYAVSFFRRVFFFFLFFFFFFLMLFLILPASLAQLDAHPSGDQEVVGLTPAGSATFFRRD